MIRIIRSIENELQEGFISARIATLNDNREAVVLVINVETDNIKQYVFDNEIALKAQILAEGAVDDRLTAKLRNHDAQRLLKQSKLEGKTLEQVEKYIDTNVTNVATAKEVLKELAGQIWMLYQAIEFLMEDK